MEALASLLTRLDGKSYKAYKDLLGEHRFEGWTLIVDHVQADPFAAPSRVRARVDAAAADLPDTVFTTDVRQCAARDYLARVFRQTTRDDKDLAIDAGAQTVIERTAVLLDDGAVELRLSLSLPARGRSIMGHQARKLICERLPETVQAAATARRLDLAALERHIAVVEDQQALRRQLPEHGIVAFVANGSILPRRSGVDDRPLQDAIPFETPRSLAVTLETPNNGPVAGMGIPEGITLIVGGGFHGKSTLLSALGLGVYDHRPGDGREQVVADAGAAKIRAEDGRAVHGLDLSPYINRLPYGKTTERFSTELASGSTSQAAALQEALEAGAHTLLVDEDTSATNFMIRDRRMQALVARESEPITPFVDRIRQLRDELSVATILVMGGSGDYFDCADTVIQLQDYHAHDVTADARAVAERFATGRETEALDPLGQPGPRPLVGRQLNPETKPGKTKIQARGPDTLVFGPDDVDLRSVEQVADPSQVRAIGQLLARVAESGARLDQPPVELAQRLQAGLAELSRRPDGDLALPRLHEVMAVLNRLRRSAFGDP